MQTIGNMEATIVQNEVNADIPADIVSLIGIASSISEEDIENDDKLSYLLRKWKDIYRYNCAASNECDTIVTRNKKDFTFSSINVLTPEELLLENIWLIEYLNIWI